MGEGQVGFHPIQVFLIKKIEIPIFPYAQLVMGLPLKTRLIDSHGMVAVQIIFGCDFIY